MTARELQGRAMIILFDTRASGRNTNGNLKREKKTKHPLLGTLMGQNGILKVLLFLKITQMQL